jgi:tryptophan synthase alpha chain
MGRIEERFAEMRRRGGPGLVAYVTAGDPDLAQSAAVMEALERGGADLIEVGVPFSDPIADGPSIQRATERALAAGADLNRSLDLIAGVRTRLSAPVVVFTYVNPVLRMGLGRFVDRAAQAGVDGVLLLDLPIEESGAVQAATSARGLDQIFLVSPTTTAGRLADAAARGRGFLYAISRLGVTGTQASVAQSAADLVGRLRRLTALPVALGFGISRPEHVREVCVYADAAVVGSAIVDVIAAAAAAGRPAAPEVERFVRWLKSGEGQGGGEGASEPGRSQ